MNVLIIGANRGIGLELCRQYFDRGDKVWAVCRSSSPALDEIGVRVIENIDVSNVEQLEELRNRLDHKSIDLMIHNSGIWRTEMIDSMNYETIREQFEINTLGPIKSVMTLLPTLSNKAKIGVMSSRMGSIADNSSGGRYGYRISKAALNAAMKSMAIDLKSQGISIAILHPGFVRTDMTQWNGDIDTDESARGLIDVMDRMSIERSGHFFHYQGHELDW